MAVNRSAFRPVAQVIAVIIPSLFWTEDLVGTREVLTPEYEDCAPK